VRFKLLYAKSVKKDLKDIPPEMKKKIKTAIETLQDFPSVRNVRKLSAHPLADYRLRVGDYRVLFDIDFDKKEIYILKIGHRREVY